MESLAGAAAVFGAAVCAKALKLRLAERTVAETKVVVENFIVLFLSRIDLFNVGLIVSADTR